MRNVIFLENEFILERKGDMIDLDEVQETPTIEVVKTNHQQPMEEVHTPKRSKRVSIPLFKYCLLPEEG